MAGEQKEESYDMRMALTDTAEQVPVTLEGPHDIWQVYK